MVDKEFVIYLKISFRSKSHLGFVKVDKKRQIVIFVGGLYCETDCCFAVSVALNRRKADCEVGQLENWVSCHGKIDQRVVFPVIDVCQVSAHI
jgi:hypothetical protein